MYQCQGVLHQNELPESAPVILEDYVRLGARAIILTGITRGASGAIAE